jgi:hypothetical protein
MKNNYSNFNILKDKGYLCKKVGGNPLYFQKIHNLNVNFLIIFLLSGSKN